MRARLFVVAVLGLLSLAPTAGDVGGCGATTTALDPNTFALARKGRDCDRCQECSITTARCQRACDSTKPPDTAIPTTCKPLDHDGEVCLRALAAASCDTYAAYVADGLAATPGECEFCKVVPPAEGAPSFSPDAAVGTP